MLFGAVRTQDYYVKRKPGGVSKFIATAAIVHYKYIVSREMALLS